jgi:hypothetical protein
MRPGVSNPRAGLETSRERVPFHVAITEIEIVLRHSSTLKWMGFALNSAVAVFFLSFRILSAKDARSRF